jgi:hypothetical protein
MLSTPVWLSTTTPVLRRRVATMFLAASLMVALVGLTPPPTADASAPSVSALSNAELEGLLSSIPLESVSAAQLSEVLAKRLSGAPTGKLRAALEKTIEGLAAKGDKIGQLAGSPELISELEKQLTALSPLERLNLEELLGVLGGRTLSSVLSEELGSLNAREAVGALLKAAGEPGQLIGPEKVIEKVLTTPSSTSLEQLLGTTLTSEPFSRSTVEGLASREGMTAAGLAEDFNATTTQLPGEAMTLTAPLADGKQLVALDAVEGVDLGTLTHEPAGSGGSGGSGSGGSGSGSSGGTGGPGGTGGSTGSSSGAPGNTTIVNQLAAPGGASPSAKAASGKVRVLRHKVKGDTITLVVQAPAAGSLTLDGKGVKRLTEQASHAEQLTVRTVLTKAEASTLRRRHRRLEMTLEVSFKPVSGSRSSARTQVAIG